jgi:hypothetical protein
MRRFLVFAGLASVLLAGPAASQSVDATTQRCIGSDAETKDLEARESVCLRELADKASRTGNVLSLKLDNGKTKTFRSNPEACGKDDANHCENYYLVGFHPSSGRYLVYGSYYESFDCKLVSARTGKATSFRNIPHFAPDGQTFFISGYDGTYDNWLGVGSMKSDPPALIWEKRSETYQDWQFVRWIDNDRIAVRDPGGNERCPGKDCEAVLKRTKGEWTLDRLPRSDIK